MFQKNKVSDFHRGTKVMEKAGGCTSTILKCVNRSQGKKPTLSHLSRQVPNTEGTRPLPGAPRPRKTALPNHKHMQKFVWLDDSWCCCSMNIHQPPGLTHTSTEDLSHEDKQHFQTTAICLHSALILCPQKRWGQHMTNAANSVLIPHAGAEKPHQRVFMALLQGSSINLLTQYFWPGSGKGYPDAVSLNLK